MARSLNPFDGWDAETMSYGNEKKKKAVKLNDATESEIKLFYKNWNDLKEEFESTRPSFYMTHGTFNCNPLLADYKYFLKGKGVEYIVIDDE